MSIEDFHIKFITKDGSLVMHRRGDSSYYFDHGRPNEEFIKGVLERDSREKGVRIVMYDLTREELIAIVEWL